MTDLKQKKTLNMSSVEFKEAGYFLVDIISQFMEVLPFKKVTQGKSPSEIKKLLSHISYDNSGKDSKQILKEASDLLFENSLFNGHPRFFGYITSSAAPIGALADMLASTLNANVGAFDLSPMATEIENQTISWLSNFINYYPNCEGLFVSGGNVANFIGVLTARKKILIQMRANGQNLNNHVSSKKPWGVFLFDEKRKDFEPKLLIYCAKGTHTWVQKAADLFGHGTDSIRWIECDNTMGIDVKKLEQQIIKDKRLGHIPFIIIGNAGTVSTGIIDKLDEISAICKTHGIWFHIDGAYGAAAASLEEMKDLFKGMDKADSIALDPHKWLYSPIEAGCILVKNKGDLKNTFSYSPEYYNFDGESSDKPINFHEYGLQNSRGFKALKVWMSLRQVGKVGFSDMIRNDILLAKKLYKIVDQNENLQAISQNLSITTFRFVPKKLSGINNEEYLNELNEKLLLLLQQSGEVYLSNAIINDRYCLRVCIVNFRTEYVDLQSLVNIVIQKGQLLYESEFVDVCDSISDMDRTKLA